MHGKYTLQSVYARRRLASNPWITKRLRMGHPNYVRSLVNKGWCLFGSIPGCLLLLCNLVAGGVRILQMYLDIASGAVTALYSDVAWVGFPPSCCGFTQRKSC